MGCITTARTSYHSFTSVSSNEILSCYQLFGHRPAGLFVCLPPSRSRQPPPPAGPSQLGQAHPPQSDHHRQLFQPVFSAVVNYWLPCGEKVVFIKTTSAPFS